MLRLRAAYLLFSCLALVFTVLGSPDSSYSDTITIRADVWCPFNCEPGSAKPGYMIEIAQEVLGAAGHKIDYQALNWARAIAETRTGSFTAIVGAAKSDAPDFVFPDVPLGNSASCFFVKPDSSWSYGGVDSLKGVALGITKDYTYGEPFDGYVRANPDKVQVASGDDTLLKNAKMLQAGRVGALVDDANVVALMLAEKKLEGLKKVGCLDPSETFIAFSPKNPKAKEYAQLLTEGVKKLRTSGKLAEILAKYGLTDWQK